MIFNNQTDLDNDYIGKVLGYNESKREIYVYVPRLMMGLNGTEIHKNTYPIDKSNISNLENLNISEYITKSNIIVAKQSDVSEGLPDIGSFVEIYFLDDNPKYCYFNKWNPNGDYKIIESERYPYLYDLKVGNKNVKIYESDIININIPDDYKVIYREDKKNKTIDILENNDKDLTISKLKSAVELLASNMNYLIEKEKENTIDVLDTNLQFIKLLPSSHIINISTIKDLLKNQLETEKLVVSNKKTFDELITINKLYNAKLKVINDTENELISADSFYDTEADPETNKSELDIKLEEANNLIDTELIPYLQYNDYEKSVTSFSKFLDHISIHKTINFYYENELIKTNSNYLLKSNIDFPTVSDINDNRDDIIYRKIYNYYTDENYINEYKETTVKESINLYCNIYELHYELVATRNNNDNGYVVGFDDLSTWTGTKAVDPNITITVNGIELEYDEYSNFYLGDIGEIASDHLDDELTISIALDFEDEPISITDVKLSDILEAGEPSEETE